MEKEPVGTRSLYTPRAGGCPCGEWGAIPRTLLHGSGRRIAGFHVLLPQGAYPLATNERPVDLKANAVAKISDHLENANGLMQYHICVTPQVGWQGRPYRNLFSVHGLQGLGVLVGWSWCHGWSAQLGFVVGFLSLVLHLRFLTASLILHHIRCPGGGELSDRLIFSSSDRH